MKTILIKKSKLALLVVVVADIIALILDYPIIYFGAFSMGWDTYNIIELVFRHIH
jgi:hypothetical protein